MRATAPRERVRQSDVARRANVSTAVVSHVLRGRAGATIRVGPDTERRVWDAVRDLGYVPNVVAQTLARGERRLLGVFTYESLFTAARGAFYVPFLLGIEEEAETRGYDLVLFTSTSGQARRRDVFREGSNRLALADGSVLLGHERSKRDVERLLREGYPFVFVGRRELVGHSIPFVAADYAGATRRLIEHLATLGHRRFGLVHGGEDVESSVDRRSGYVTGLTTLGHAPGAASASMVRADAASAPWLRTALDGGTTALLVENDGIGRRMLALAREDGVRVPDDLSVAVLGDPLEPEPDDPPWTTFAIPRREMGREAVALLLQVIAGLAGPEAQRTLACALVAGATAAPPPSGRT